MMMIWWYTAEYLIIIVIIPQKIFILTVIDRRIKNHRTNTSYLTSDTLMKHREMGLFSKIKIENNIFKN
jgi:hypothetical protein